MAEYQKKLGQLKRNKENVPLEMLQTTYQRSYSMLKAELKGMTEEILKAVVLSNLLVEQLFKDEAFWKINHAIEDSGLLTGISHAVYREQDADKVLKCTEQLRIVVHQAVKKVDEGYCRIRKQMQDNGICEHDIEAAIELMKGIRGEEAYGT